MWIIYVDADACPVKEEIYKVAKRFEIKVVIAANNPMRIPNHPLVELVEKKGFDGVDDWIALMCETGDLVITADIPLAARSLAKGAHVLDPRGKPFTESDIGYALASRDLMNELRQSGEITGGPAPMTPKDRSRFLAKLDETLHKLKKLGTQKKP
ncbi:YaiI/YqxD family protein [Telmatocola sphagniphila]|jgi:uncharacterized protein YaiI (UPF0178 family)|uniref:UPF0178 protein KIH39_09635 n=1 Tax=Telmatocola sphagniphila TaxID=1123043 RepID=A0A8E6EZW1_9BACT|nr:YaiI/YqxD family protein [Telmatocola sphagniphila]QVL34148.1 YaiI/YqxD family protein [Telmatocola sphagniphila]